MHPFHALAAAHAAPSSGINWGDVPTWIAVFVAAVGGTVALVQLRQQGNVLKGEAERNKRRDELLDGQLRDLAAREEARARDQAEMVDVQWEVSPGIVETTVLVNNHSRRPVTAIDAALVQWPFRGLTQTHKPGLWGVRSAPGAPLISSAPGLLSVLRPGAVGQCAFPYEGDDEADARLVVRFTDDAGRRWELDHYMHLEPAPDKRW